MAKTSYRDWVDDEFVTASMLNEQIRDNGNAIWVGTTSGDLDYYASSTEKTRLPIGSETRVLGVVNGVPAWANYIGARIKRSAPNSTSHDTDSDVLSFDLEDTDSGGFHTGTDNKIVIPANYEGFYIIGAGGFFSGHVTAGKLREIGIKRSGVYIAKTSAVNDSGVSTWMNVTTAYYLSAGNEIKLGVLQNSGTSLDFYSATLWVAKIR